MLSIESLVVGDPLSQVEAALIHDETERLLAVCFLALGFDVFNKIQTIVATKPAKKKRGSRKTRPDLVVIDESRNGLILEASRVSLGGRRKSRQKRAIAGAGLGNFYVQVVRSDIELFRNAIIANDTSQISTFLCTFFKGILVWNNQIIIAPSDDWIMQMRLSQSIASDINLANKIGRKF
ncbi:MAG: hypothetical protein H6774_02440 [Pseudomonadales bacterium]|nr:hypothetical protein [Candidatus Woesebacteria bacterium]MCB9801923.1 hypothetical protein [Pseudomonadales bacterium]